MRADALQQPSVQFQQVTRGAGDRLSYSLVLLALILLPGERVDLPLSLKPVDFVLVLIMAYGILKSPTSGRRFYFPLVFPFWLILIAGLLATIGGLDRAASVTAIIQEIYLYAWFFLLTNLLAGFSFSNLDRLFKIWASIAVIEAIVTLMGMMTSGLEIFYTSPENEVLASFTGLARGLGTFVNPNAAGAYLSISIFVTLSTSWSKLLRLGIASILFAGIFGSGSLGALLSSSVGLLALGWMSYFWGKPQLPEIRRSFLVLIGGIMILGFCVVFLILLVIPAIPILMEQEWLALTLGRLPRSFDLRLQLLSRAWSAYIIHPIGIGPNAAQTFSGAVHNDYAAFLFERGLLGLVGWLLFVGSWLLSPLLAAGKEEWLPARWALLCLAAGLFACAINAFTHEISHFRQLWMLLAFTFAIKYMVNARTSNPALDG